MSHQDVPSRPVSQCSLTCDGTSCPIKTTLIHTYKLKHFVPLRRLVSVKHCFVGPRKSLEEVFLYLRKSYQIAPLPAGLFKPKNTAD